MIGETRAEVLAYLQSRPYGQKVYASGATEDILRSLVLEGLAYEDGQGFCAAPKMEKTVEGDAWTAPKVAILAAAALGVAASVMGVPLLLALWWLAGPLTFEIALHVAGGSVLLMWAIVVGWSIAKTR